MTDSAYIVSRTLENKIAIAENNDQNTLLVTLDVLKEILSTLKEQKAVKPTLVREGRNKYFSDYVCPGCDNDLTYEQNYCSECGRALVWE